MTEQFANNASSTLNGAIDNVTTTVVIQGADASKFPTLGNFRLLIGTNPLTAEIVLVTGVSGATFTVIRGQENTTAQSWGNGTTVTHILTAGAVEAARANLRKDKPLHVSLDTIGASQDGYALTWSNADGYWAARPGSQWTTANATEIYTTKTTSIDSGGTLASAHGDGSAKLYVNGKILSTTFSAGEIPLTTQAFSYVSDALQQFTVPAGVTSVKIKMWGPGGGSGNYAGSNGGGPGGYSTGFLSVTPGEVLQLAVGSGGKHPVSTAGNGGNGGWPNGGFGTRGDASGAGGGGFTGIFTGSMTQANALIIAGGGGGATGFSGGNGAGAGGGLTAGGSTSGTAVNGRGGSQSAGGADGNGNAATSTTIASGSNGVGLPTTTINVASTSTFPTSGVLLVTTSAGTQIVGYTGKNATQFTGCTLGTGTMSTGNAVVYAVAGSALTGGIAYQDQTSSQPTGNDDGGGGSGYFGGGAGQGDGRSGGGGSGFLHATRITNGVTTTGTNANVNAGSTLPPNTTDVNYSAGVGIGGAATGAAGTDGGNGYIVLQWGGITTLDFDSIDFGNTSTISTVDTNMTISPATNGTLTLSAAGASGGITLSPTTSGLITLSSSATDIALTSGTSNLVINAGSAQRFKTYSSGAIVIGGADAQNDTSAEAQAGLTGPLLNLSSSTGTISTTTNQATIFNQSGALNLQGNTETRFLTGSTLRGYFDSNGVFRTGPSASTSASAFGISWPAAATDTVFVHNASGNSYYTNWSGLSTGVGGFLAYNTSAGASATIGVALGGAGLSHATTAIAGNGFIEQAGSATSALVFRKILGNSTSGATTGRIYQSGAWVLGENTNNDTSAEAQAGLTGTILNISQTTGGTLTSVANQSLLYNSAGTVILQGHVGHSFIANTTTVASTSTSKFITNVGRRVATNVKTANYTVTTSDEIIIVGTLASSITITLPAGPTAGDIYTVKDQGGGAATNNIIISGNGNNIDGGASYTMNTNYQSITVVFANGSWSII